METIRFKEVGPGQRDASTRPIHWKKQAYLNSRPAILVAARFSVETGSANAAAINRVEDRWAATPLLQSVSRPFTSVRPCAEHPAWTAPTQRKLAGSRPTVCRW